MVLPTGLYVVTNQTSVRHTGNRLVVSESIEDDVLSREKDTGHYDQEG